LIAIKTGGIGTIYPALAMRLSPLATANREERCSK
jgi:hypothetical protein